MRGKSASMDEAYRALLESLLSLFLDENVEKEANDDDDDDNDDDDDDDNDDDDDAIIGAKVINKQKRKPG